MPYINSEHIIIIASFAFNLITIIIVLKIKGISIYKRSFFSKTKRLELVYEKIENIHTKEEAALKKDLSNRLGIEVIGYQIHSIDFLKDIAELTVFYKKPKMLSTMEIADYHENSENKPILNEIKI